MVWRGYIGAVAEGDGGSVRWGQKDNNQAFEEYIWFKWINNGASMCKICTYRRVCQAVCRVGVWEVSRHSRQAFPVGFRPIDQRWIAIFWERIRPANALLFDYSHGIASDGRKRTNASNRLIYFIRMKVRSRRLLVGWLHLYLTLRVVSIGH